MKKIEISGKMPKISKIFSNINFMVLGVVFLIMLIVAVSFGGTVYDSYVQAQQNKEKIIEMEKYISDWLEKSEIVNNSKMHPVKPEELDKVQTVLLTSLKQHGLNITGFQSEKPPVTPQDTEVANNTSGQTTEKPQPSKNKFHDYELNLEVNFLNSIHQNNILISIRSLKLHQQQGIIKVDLKYRVYTK